MELGTLLLFIPLQGSCAPESLNAFRDGSYVVLKQTGAFGYHIRNIGLNFLGKKIIYLLFQMEALREKNRTALSSLCTSWTTGYGHGKYPCLQVLVNLTHSGQKVLLHYNEEAVQINSKVVYISCVKVLQLQQPCHGRLSLARCSTQGHLQIKLFSSREHLNSDPIRINEAKSIPGGKMGYIEKRVHIGVWNLKT